MKQREKRIVRYFMLLVSVLLLLTVIVPHHHHANGLPCYHFLTAAVGAHDVGDDCSSCASHGDTTHDCGCNGHNQALFTSLQAHITDGDVSQYLFPLLTLFEYINPLEISGCDCLFCRVPVYSESLRDHWIARATGLRAPPALS